MPSETPPSNEIVSNTEPGLIAGPEPLTGKHVTLEPLTQDHFSDLWENVGSHDEVFTWWPEGPYNEPDEFFKGFKEIMELDAAAPYSVAPYAVILQSGPHRDKAVGCVFAGFNKPLSNRTSEIGALFGPHLQKSKASTEAIYLLCDMLFEKLNYRRMAWKTNALNVGSRRAAERYGLRYEGTWRQDEIQKGRNRDTAWFAMVDEEWGFCKRAFEVWLGEGNFDGEGRQRRRIEDVRREIEEEQERVN